MHPYTQTGYKGQNIHNVSDIQRAVPVGLTVDLTTMKLAEEVKP